MKECVGRELNPGLTDGNREYSPLYYPRVILLIEKYSDYLNFLKN